MKKEIKGVEENKCEEEKEFQNKNNEEQIRNVENCMMESNEKEDREMPSTIKKSFNYEENDLVSTSKVRKLSFFGSEDEDPSENEFDNNVELKQTKEMKDAMEQFFGYEKVEDSPVDKINSELPQNQNLALENNKNNINRERSEKKREGIKVLLRILDIQTKMRRMNAFK